MPTTAEPRSIQTQRQMRRWVLFTLTLGALSIGLSVALGRVGPLPAPVRYGGAAGALVLILLWAHTAIGFHRSLDELQVRIFLEVTSLIGIAALAWLYLFPVLEKTGVVGPLTHDAYALAVVPISLLAWWVTVRRYQ